MNPVPARLSVAMTQSRQRIAKEPQNKVLCDCPKQKDFAAGELLRRRLEGREGGKVKGAKGEARREGKVTVGAEAGLSIVSPDCR